MSWNRTRIVECIANEHVDFNSVFNTIYFTMALFVQDVSFTRIICSNSYSFETRFERVLFICSRGPHVKLSTLFRMFFLAQETMIVIPLHVHRSSIAFFVQNNVRIINVHSFFETRFGSVLFIFTRVQRAELSTWFRIHLQLYYKSQYQTFISITNIFWQWPPIIFLLFYTIFLCFGRAVFIFTRAPPHKTSTLVRARNQIVAILAARWCRG